MLKNNTYSTPVKTKSTDSMNDAAMADADGEKEKLIVEAYMPPDPGPYPQDQPRQNSVRFTPYRLKSSPQVFSQDLQWWVHLVRERQIQLCRS